MESKKFAVIGGDSRNLSLAKFFEDDGHLVSTFALGDLDCATLDIAVTGADVVVGPIPFSNDGKTLNTPLYNESILINNFLKAIGKKSIIVAGKFEDATISQADYYKITIVDILKREDFAVLNAIPTAEGAIQIAMQETHHTINSSNVCVIGYGRIGKTVSRMLNGLGANVYVALKSFEEKAYAKAFAIHTIHISELENYLPKMDIIINTAPAKILDFNILKKVNKQSLIIDVASSPGGVEFDKARELGIKTIWALSLPGKVAPLSSACIIRDTVYNILAELEE